MSAYANRVSTRIIATVAALMLLSGLTATQAWANESGQESTSAGLTTQAAGKTLRLGKTTVDKWGNTVPEVIVLGLTSGTASYNSDSHTLTLTNAKFESIRVLQRPARGLRCLWT